MYTFVLCMCYLYFWVKHLNIYYCHIQILHQLTARAIIRDWTDGSLDVDRTQHEVGVVCVRVLNADQFTI